jgi:propionyl-CoA carboxylase beta chain
MIVPSDPNKGYDMALLVKKIADDGNFYQIAPDFAKNILVGFVRMEGKTVGVVANQVGVFFFFVFIIGSSVF